jgi:Na+(H+)/acetate symporter ActP
MTSLSASSEKALPREKDEVKVAKIATVGLGVAAVLLGILFKGQNVAFMVVLPLQSPAALISSPF